jgi:hypothetical protein
MLDLQLALPRIEQLTSAKLPAWLRENGQDLSPEVGASWRCLETVYGMETSVAKSCARAKIAYFLPLLLAERNTQLKPLWPLYLFCRSTPSQQSHLAKNRRVKRILIPPDEEDLLEHLRLFSPISRQRTQYLPGDRVEITSEPFTGYVATVIGALDLRGILTLELAGSRYPLRLIKHINDVRPASGARPKLAFVPEPIVTFVEEKPASRVADDPGASSEKATLPVDLVLELDAFNEELYRYLDKHPEQMYQMDPRRFEMLVADLLADMGYDVELTPESRDGGRDILAAFRLPAGEILTIVECKRYAPDNKVGVEIVERFFFAVDRRDNASCGLIATTSFFTEGARALENQFRWRLGLKDFDVLRGWIGNYGRWSLDDSAGIWLAGTDWNVPRSRVYTPSNPGLHRTPGLAPSPDFSRR